MKTRDRNKVKKQLGIIERAVANAQKTIGYDDFVGLDLAIWDITDALEPITTILEKCYQNDKTHDNSKV